MRVDSLGTLNKERSWVYQGVLLGGARVMQLTLSGGVVS